MLWVKSSVWKSLSCVGLFVTWTGAHQAPLSMGFSRKEYLSGLPFPSPGDLPDSGIESRSPTLQADSLPSELNRTWKLKVLSKPRSHKKFEMQESDLDRRKDEVVGKHRKPPFPNPHCTVLHLLSTQTSLCWVIESFKIWWGFIRFYSPVPTRDPGPYCVTGNCAWKNAW